VGRAAEFGLLRDRFNKVASGHGQVVFLVGEPGIGKSRLLFELRTVLAGQATWLEGRCLSYGRTIALHPIVGLLKTAFSLDDGDSEAIIVEKLERAIRRLGYDLQPTFPYFKYLLSVDTGDPRLATMDPRLRRSETFDALRRLLLRAAEIEPQVIVIEDLHWVDKATEDALLTIVNSITTARVLLVLTYRPGYQHPFGERTTYTRVALDVLDAVEMVRMTRGLLRAKEVPPELDSLVSRKAEGNPFFVEEVVRSLEEIGTLRRHDAGYEMVGSPGDGDVPGTVQDLVMARIDRLREPPKRALQVASVIGREFARKLLDRTAKLDQMDDLLRELQSLELIFEKTVFPDPAYMFKHALTHDVAYNSLLLQRRKELHRLTALAIEELYGDRLVEHYELLAYHFQRADDWPHALDYLMKAADKAAKAFANREALALLDQALDACARLRDTAHRATVAKVYQMQTGLYFAVSDFENASRAAAALLDEARGLGNEALVAGALAGLAWTRFWAHDFDQANERAHEAIVLGERLEAPRVVLPARWTLILDKGIRGHLDEAERDLQVVLGIAQDAGDLTSQGLGAYLRSFIRNWRGEYGDGVQIASEGITQARQHGLVTPLILNLWTLSLNLVGAGQYARAKTTLDDLLMLTERAGEELHWLKALNVLGWLHFECGDLRSALELNRRCADHVRTKMEPEVLGNAQLNLADAFLAGGDLVLAGELLAEVLRMVDDPAVSEWMKWRYSTHLFASLGELAVARGDVDAVRRWTDQCLEVAMPRRSRKYIAKALRLRGEAFLRRRDLDEADDHLRRALAVARAIANPTQLWRTHVSTARLAEARADPRKAEEEWTSAHQVIAMMTAAMNDQALSDCLMRLSLVREVQERTRR
jgi:tetratricopeptide (TPR) repeat protein